MDWATTINLGGFGNAAEMEWETIKSWDSFTGFFDNAVHIDAVTYCESPELLLELFDQPESELETMDVLLGNREEYQSSVDDATVKVYGDSPARHSHSVISWWEPGPVILGEESETVEQLEFK